MSVGWAIAAGLAGAGAGGAAAYGAFAPRSSMFGAVTWRGGADGDAIALTFDDGPDPHATAKVLDTLGEFGVSATFFVIGRNVQRHPDVLRRVHDAGHLIANHTFDHHNTGLFRGRRYWLDQLDRTDDEVERVTGSRTTLFRPPMGFKHPHLFAAARRRHRVVTWTRRAFDGVPATAQQIVARLGDRARPGDILLLHDAAPPGRKRDPAATVTALPILLRTWRDRGLRVERLDTLLANHAPA